QRSARSASVLPVIFMRRACSVRGLGGWSGCCSGCPDGPVGDRHGSVIWSGQYEPAFTVTPAVAGEEPFSPSTAADHRVRDGERGADLRTVDRAFSPGLSRGA